MCPAKTSVLLLDGEETVIGGLYVMEESKSREGVPFLKDLPWWFFGLRYAFGFEAKNVLKKELLILIKAELVPELRQRIAIKKSLHKRGKPTLLEERLKNKKRMEYLKKQSKPIK